MDNPWAKPPRQVLPQRYFAPACWVAAPQSSEPAAVAQTGAEKAQTFATARGSKKPAGVSGGLLYSAPFAEEEGFEPPDLLQSAVFKTAAIDHSAIPLNDLMALG